MSQLAVNTISSASLILLFSLACYVSYLPTRILNFSLAGLITVGAYTSYFLTNVVHLSLITALILGTIVSSLIGIGLDILVLGQFRRNNATGWMPFVASIGLYVVLQNAVSVCFGESYKSFNLGPTTVGLRIAGGFITTTQLLNVIASIFFTGAFLLVIRFTKIGRAFAGVSSNPDLCRILGINTEQVVLWSVAVASVICAMAGVLAGLDTNIFPTMGFRLLMNGIIVMIIAGVGSIRGLVSAALLLAASQHVAAYYWDSKWVDAVTSLILIVFLFCKPLGFSGRLLKKVEI